LKYLGKAESATQVELDLIDLLHPMVEAAVKDELGWGVVRDSYVDFLPDSEQDVVYDPFTDDGASPAEPNPSLSLRQRYIVSLDEVRVVWGGTSGVAGDFSADTIIPASAYALDRTGRLYTKRGSWPTSLYGVMVTYTAGLTRADLQGPYSAIRLATLMCFSATFYSRLLGAAGPIVREKYPMYEVEYADHAASAGGDVIIPEAARRRLEPHRRYRL
jgi:hypothetical protein